MHGNTKLSQTQQQMKSNSENLLEICSNQFMLQMIEESTREQNTLDLMFSNEVDLVTMIEVTKSNYSDHDMIELSTNYSITERENMSQRDVRILDLDL